MRCYARRCVAFVGLSGRDKSSLLRAGLIPLLQRTPDPLLRPAALRVLTPGEQPVRTHGDVLAPVPGSHDTRGWSSTSTSTTTRRCSPSAETPVSSPPSQTCC
ncbi:hypothetical protein [Streptomyces sp. NPDC058308]|uniref:nSTAND1 domain-containing NTPase n=1 Tax=Streptomyces sp. NPDC058308 TaxID=3346440 RepID=UPI0036EEE19C